MSFAAGDRLWGRGVATATTTKTDDDGFLDFSEALDHVERRGLPVHMRAWVRLVGWYGAANLYFQGSGLNDDLMDPHFDARSEPDFVPTQQPRAIFNEEAFLSASPPGISTPVTAVFLLVLFIAGWVQGGFGAAVFALAMSAMLTALYVLCTGRASWARVPARNHALILLGASLVVFLLCKLLAG